jgi:hypothetical protein
MTPKQTAENLVNEFRMILMDEDTDCGNEVLCTLIAIKCARVVVNELYEFNKSHYQRVNCELDNL